jgi:hypothetical protein
MDAVHTVRPIIASLTSEDTYVIPGRGTVYVVPNPRDTDNDDWSWLIGQRVMLDGYLVEVWAVESYRILGLYRKGRPIGVMVRGMPEDSYSI